jgi:hypothetical protein
MRNTRRSPKNAHKALVQNTFLQITRSRGAANPHSCSRGTTRPTPCVHETHSTRSQGALFWYFGIRSQGADTHTRRNHTAQGAAGIHGMPCPSLHAHEALVYPIAYALTRRCRLYAHEAQSNENKRSNKQYPVRCREETPACCWVLSQGVETYRSCPPWVRLSKSGAVSS